MSSELIDITTPVWDGEGREVRNLRRTGQPGPHALTGEVVFVGLEARYWSEEGIFFSSGKMSSEDLTNTPPVEAIAPQPTLEPESIPGLAAENIALRSENAALRQENEHLKQEVIRMHAEYRTLWDMMKKIQGRRETSR